MKILWIFLIVSSFLHAEPEAIYLTVSQDPSHSMRIHWIEKKRGAAYPAVLYQKENEWKWKRRDLNSLEFLDISSKPSLYLVKEAYLTGLEANTMYRFCLEGAEKVYRFRTLPNKTSSPLTVCVGGDFTNDFRLYSRMNRMAAQRNPHFAILGGDIAYAYNNGFSIRNNGTIGKWISFFKEWQKSMLAEGDRMIPMAPLVGNHDVNSQDRFQKGKNSLYRRFFPYEEGVSYRTIDIAGVVSFFLLDSGHLFPVRGDQTNWLKKELNRKEGFAWKIPAYHVAAYPSTYPYKEGRAALIRETWVPLFERYGVKLAFEHHNHAFKRTYALLNEQIDASGIVYIGDGAWGGGDIRKPKNNFYLAKSRACACFSILFITPASLLIETFDTNNAMIDKWEIKGPTSSFEKFNKLIQKNNYNLSKFPLDFLKKSQIERN